jgi:hypothetical protein
MDVLQGPNWYGSPVRTRRAVHREEEPPDCHVQTPLTSIRLGIAPVHRLTGGRGADAGLPIAGRSADDPRAVEIRDDRERLDLGATTRRRLNEGYRLVEGNSAAGETTIRRRAPGGRLRQHSLGQCKLIPGMTTRVRRSMSFLGFSHSRSRKRSLQQ